MVYCAAFIFRFARKVHIPIYKLACEVKKGWRITILFFLHFLRFLKHHIDVMIFLFMVHYAFFWNYAEGSLTNLLCFYVVLSLAKSNFLRRVLKNDAFWQHLLSKICHRLIAFSVDYNL